MADDDIDVEGEFNFKLETGGGLHDANELPSKSANLLPEFTNPPWMLEQGWSLDNGMDEKSKATIEKMLLEEQQYINGRKTGKYLGINKSVLLITASQTQKPKCQESVSKRQWTDEEKDLFMEGLAKYGHSWSKISQLIPSRTTIQVKNYAKQYLKTQAKRMAGEPKESSVLPSASASGTAAAPGVTNTATSASCSYVDSEIIGSTARPTIIARSRPLVKSKLTKQKVTVEKNDRRVVSVVNVGGTISLLDRSLLSSFPAVNGCVTGKGSVTATNSKDVTQLPESRSENVVGKSPVNAFSTTAEQEKISDSESEIDIDIENDDEDGNDILQSRSASPSSVYNKLLEQARVCVNPPLDKSQHEHYLGEQEEEEHMEGEIHDTEREEKLDNVEHKEQCWTEHSHRAVLSLSTCERTGKKEGEGTGREPGEEPWQPLQPLGEQCVENHDGKHIVNGVTSSSGEVFEFPIPIEDRELLPDHITEEEKSVHSEFFDGRPLKTPERYLKIRNYIMDCWKKSRPGYLNKTSVRPGLKNCGDVNCIGRIHAYLECIGAINFGCEQAAYNNPGRGTTIVPKLRHLGRDHQPVLSAAKLDAMRPRKRRIRDASGHWVDEKELEGKTIEHKPEEEDVSKAKSCRNRKIIYDPFKLVPCQPFTQDKPAPFRLEVLSTALAVMDIHAHISRTEVIGMLGGQFDSALDCLNISMAIPCKSISTGMQCEMDPVSQTLASEQIEDVGMCVVGWYHSHPTFAPSPSVRDIETQQKFQHWFAKGGSHFVGLIISPYSPHNSSVVSDIRCLTIGDDVAKEYLCNTPYQFSYSMVYRDNMREILGPASELAEKYATYSSRVGLSCIYKSSLGITCLSKMLQSVKHRLEPPEEEYLSGSRRKVDDVLHWLEQIFLDKFSSNATDSSADVKITPTATAVPLSDDDVQV